MQVSATVYPPRRDGYVTILVDWGCFADVRPEYLKAA